MVFNPSIVTWKINTSNPIWQVIRWTVWRSPIMRIYGGSHLRQHCARAGCHPAWLAGAFTPCNRLQPPNATHIVAPPRTGYDTYIKVLYFMVVAVFVAVLGLVWLTLAMRKQEQSKWLKTASKIMHVMYDLIFMMLYVSWCCGVVAGSVVLPCMLGSAGQMRWALRAL